MRFLPLLLLAALTPNALSTGNSRTKNPTQEIKELSQALVQENLNLSLVTEKPGDLNQPESYHLGKYELDGIEVVEWTYPMIFEPNKVMGWQHPAGKSVRHILRTRTKMIWDTLYTYDLHGNRITPHEQENTKKFIAFFGGSFVHGNGLTGHETLPAQTVKHLTGFKAYNLGISASGPHQHLARVQSHDFIKNIEEKRGHFIYVLLAQHIQRANGFAIQRSLNVNQPMFDFSKGRAVNIGSFWQNEPIKTWILRTLHKKLNLFRRLNRNYPTVKPSHLEYTCKILTEMEKSLADLYLDFNFSVYSHPLSPPPAELITCLTDQGIDVIQPVPISKEERPAHQFFLDHHPNAGHNAKYGKIIAKRIIEVNNE